MNFFYRALQVFCVGLIFVCQARLSANENILLTTHDYEKDHLPGKITVVLENLTGQSDDDRVSKIELWEQRREPTEMAESKTFLRFFLPSYHGRSCFDLQLPTQKEGYVFLQGFHKTAAEGYSFYLKPLRQSHTQEPDLIRISKTKDSLKGTLLADIRDEYLNGLESVPQVKRGEHMIQILIKNIKELDY